MRILAVFDIIHYDYTHMFCVEIKNQTHIQFMEKEYISALIWYIFYYSLFQFFLL